MSVIAHLERRVAGILDDARHHPLFTTVFAPDVDPGLLLAVGRNVLLRTYHYGPHVVEASFTAIGRFPKAKPQVMRPLVEHILDEVPHPEIALKDYARLGGDEAAARQSRITPAAFAVAATCRMLAERESPYAYLGFLALLEFTTPVLTERVLPVLRSVREGRATKFIPLHATVDVKHAAELKEEIGKVVAAAPEAGPAIEYGFACFAQVYPRPVWDEALEQARAEAARPGGGGLR